MKNRVAFLVFAWMWLIVAVPGRNVEAETVVLQLRWAPQFQFAGYYAAQWQGYYEEAGISVEIRSALRDGAILSAVDQVALGEADFGIGAADILLENAAQADLVVVASILQESAAALYSLSDTELDSPDDLLDLTRARTKDSLIDIEVRAMMLLEGLDPEGGRTIPYEPGIRQLLQEEADVVPGYQIAGPWVFEEEGIEYHELRPSSFGVKFYGDSLFTRAELAGSKPDLVARFRDASLRGWEYAFGHVEEVSQRLTEMNREDDPLEDAIRFNLWQAEQMRKLALYPAVELGHVNARRWEQMRELLSTLGIVSGEPDVNHFVFDPRRLLAGRRRRALIGSTVVAGVLLLGAGIALVWSIMLRRKVKERTQSLREAVRQRDQLFQEMNHRVKNNLLMVTSLLRLRERDTSKESDLSGVMAQVNAISKVHELLSHIDGTVEIPAREYIQEVVTSTFESAHAVSPEIDLDVDNVDVPSRKAVTLGLILSELATNAAKHGFEPRQADPRFAVRFRKDSARGKYILAASNNGRRFPDETEPTETSSLGLRLVNDLVAQLGGDMTLSREPVTTFEISAPIDA